MTCDEARVEIVAYLRSELPPARASKLEDHLAGCLACRQEMESAKAVLSWTQAASEEAVVQRLQRIMDGAIQAAATDVHIDPRSGNTLRVRYRVDGMLQDAEPVEPMLRHGVIARLKMLGGMSVTAASLPQSGRAGWPDEGPGRAYNLCLNCVPVLYGESVVIRLLDRTADLPKEEQLGLSEQQKADIGRIIASPSGLVLICGPSGCGKTTTGLMLLKRLATTARSVISIENPVEITLPGVNQIQVSARQGLTYAAALHAVVRHDADIIYLGDIPDLQTAEQAVDTALSGHLVLAVLHAEDGASGLWRLLDMGVQPYLLAEAFAGVLSQRLVRRVCRQCGKPAEPSGQRRLLATLGIQEADLAGRTLMLGEGCGLCHGTGYSGRTVILEVTPGGMELSRTIAERRGPERFRATAREKGCVSLLSDARRKVLEGITTAQETTRVLGVPLDEDTE